MPSVSLDTASFVRSTPESATVRWSFLVPKRVNRAERDGGHETSAMSEKRHAAALELAFVPTVRYERAPGTIHSGPVGGVPRGLFCE